MKLLKLGMLLLVITLNSCNQQQPVETPELNEDEQLSLQLGNSVLWYQRSAEMRQSYYQAYHYAKLLLDSKLAARQSDKIAVVLDIDETVLDNSPSEAELILTATMYNDENWFKWIQMARAEALPGAKDFVDYAAQKGVEVFYISNREKFNMEPTLKNLIDLNFPFADTTHVLLKNGTSDKTARRSKISSDFEILVFVGDNLTDYSQLYANRDEGMGKQLVDDNKEELLANFVMLPNPMYGEWEKAIYDNNYELEVGKKLQKRKEVLIGY